MSRAGILPTTPQAPAGAPPADHSSGDFAQRAGYALLLIYLFDVFARLPEFSVVFLGSAYFQSPILMGLTALAAFMTGRMLQPVRTRVGRWLLVYNGWLILATPFSFWRTGSLKSLGYSLRFFLFFFLIYALVRNLDQCRRVMYALAAGAVPIFLAVAWFGIAPDGRLSVAFGRFRNPNELAGYILMLTPLWLFVATTKRYNIAHRVLAFSGCVIALAISVRTGSRGALLMAGIMLLVMFWHYSLAGKVRLLAVLFPLVVLTSAITPEPLRLRYQATFASEEELTEEPTTWAEVGAFASMQAREDLLKHSIILTLRNPIVGVGPGTFAAAAAADSADRGQRARWQVTHNTYTQVSSEAGIPALIFFLGAIISAYRQVLAVRRLASNQPALAEVRNMAFCLLLTMTGYCGFGMVNSIAGEFYFYTFMGLLTVVAELAKAQISALSARPEASATPPHSPGTGGRMGNQVWSGVRLRAGAGMRPAASSNIEDSRGHKTGQFAGGVKSPGKGRNV